MNEARDYTICPISDGRLYVEVPSFSLLSTLLLTQKFRREAHFRTGEGSVPYFGGGIAFDAHALLLRDRYVVSDGDGRVLASAMNRVAAHRASRRRGNVGGVVERTARWPGKQTRENVYVHVSALGQLPAQVRRSIEAARKVAGIGVRRFDVVKLGVKKRSVSFLAYPGFFREAFPRLREAWTVDLADGTSSHREYSGNVPILHRKEEMLSADHPSAPAFEKLTQDAERRGLFSDPNAIGNADAWRARLQRRGLRVVGHRLVAR